MEGEINFKQFVNEQKRRKCPENVCNMSYTIRWPYALYYALYRELAQIMPL